MYQINFPHGLMFHHFYDDNHIRGQGAISATDFANMIEYVGRENILDASEWLELYSKGKLPDKALCLTFDDCLKCQFDVAVPVLEHFKIKAFWFVYTSIFEGKRERLEIYRYFRTEFFKSVEDFYKEFSKFAFENGYKDKYEEEFKKVDVKDIQKNFPFYTVEDIEFRCLRDRVLGPACYSKLMDSLLVKYKVDEEDLAEKLWLDRSDIQYLHKNGHIVGLHSHTHPTVLADLNEKDQTTEYSKNLELITAITGKRPDVVSHPCNSYNDTTLKILKNFGVVHGFRANMAVNPPKSDLEVPREDHSNIMKKMHAR